MRKYYKPLAKFIVLIYSLVHFQLLRHAGHHRPLCQSSLLRALYIVPLYYNRPNLELSQSKLQKLEILDLTGTQITDAGLKDVAKLQKLTILELTGTQVTAAGVSEISKALPDKCRIYSNPTK